MASSATLVCALCAKPDPPSRCAGCREASYCNQACQVAHWPHHRTVCRATKAFNDEADIEITLRKEGGIDPRSYPIAIQLIARAFTRLPPAELAYAREAFAERKAGGLISDDDGPEPSDNQAIMGFVWCRLSNPICNHCRRYPPGKFFLCGKCCAAWFCSAACKGKDNRHRDWCANPSASRDTGPMAITFAPISKVKWVSPSGATVRGVDMERATRAEGMKASPLFNRVADKLTQGQLGELLGGPLPHEVKGSRASPGPAAQQASPRPENSRNGAQR